MGDAIEPFNLRNEREDGGHFDENMNYVFKKERGEIDAWVADMDEVSMEKAIGEAAQAMKRKLAKEEQEEENEALRVHKSSLELRKELLKMLLPGETLAKAMRRLGTKEGWQYYYLRTLLLTDSFSVVRPHHADSKKLTAFQRKVAASRMDTSSSSHAGEDGGHVAVVSATAEEAAKARSERNKAQIHAITEIADELMSSAGGALTGIYDMTYEAILNSTRLWEYMGLQGDGAIHGPFTAQQISAWKAQGYLTGPTAVMIRHCGEILAPPIQQRQQRQNSNNNNNKEVERRQGRKAKFVESIYEEEEEEEANDLLEGNNKKRKVSETDAGAAASMGGLSNPAQAAAVQTPYVKGPWENSDEVVFGAFPDLQQEEEQRLIQEERVRRAKSNNGNVGDNITRRSSSTSAAVAMAMAGEHAQAAAADEEEDDEDMGFRSRKARSRGNEGMRRGGDDDDDDD